MDIDTKIQQIVMNAIEAHIFPGTVIGYIRNGETKVLPFGHLTYEENSPKVTFETVYDIASLTKVIPVAAIILRLVEQGLISLDDYAVSTFRSLPAKARTRYASGIS